MEPNLLPHWAEQKGIYPMLTIFDVKQNVMILVPHSCQPAPMSCVPIKRKKESRRLDMQITGPITSSSFLRTLVVTKLTPQQIDSNLVRLVRIGSQENEDFQTNNLFPYKGVRALDPSSARWRALPGGRGVEPQKNMRSAEGRSGRRAPT